MKRKKQIVVVNENGEYNGLLNLGLEMGWCTPGWKHEHTFQEAQLCVRCPHEIDAYEKNYYFKFAECGNGYNPHGTGIKQRLAYIYQELMGMDDLPTLFDELISEQEFDDANFVDRLYEDDGKMSEIYKELDAASRKVESVKHLIEHVMEKIGGDVFEDYNGWFEMEKK